MRVATQPSKWAGRYWNAVHHFNQFCTSRLEFILKKVKCYLTDYMFYLDLIITTTLKLETFVGLLFFYMQKIDNEHNELTRKLTKNYNNKNNRKY